MVKDKDPLIEIQSLEHRMNHPMPLDEAEKFDAELFKQTFGDKKAEDEANYVFDDDEYMEYTPIMPNKSLLPVECMADDGGSYKMRNHPLWFLMANGYGDDYTEFIPITVDKFAKIIGKHDIKVSQSDIEKVREFIYNNMDLLVKLGNGEIRNVDFLNNMNTYQYRMAESVERGQLNEMSKLYTIDTNLPADIWVDNAMGKRNIQHRGARIKFQSSKGEKNTKTFSTIYFNEKGEITVDKLPSNTDLKKRDINKIIEFVKINFDLLIALYKNEIDMNFFMAHFKPLP